MGLSLTRKSGDITIITNRQTGEQILLSYRFRKSFEVATQITAPQVYEIRRIEHLPLDAQEEIRKKLERK